jgi:hypothetical protein
MRKVGDPQFGEVSDVPPDPDISRYDEWGWSRVNMVGFRTSPETFTVPAAGGGVSALAVAEPPAMSMHAVSTTAADRKQSSCALLRISGSCSLHCHVPEVG